MNVSAAPAEPGTPAAPAPGAATPPSAAPGAATQPNAANTPTPFNTPWTNVQGVYMIGEGDQAKPWYEGIQEEPVREYIKAKNYANPYEAAMAAYNANKINKLTPEVEAVLSGKATPEQEAAYYKALGRPDTPDAYEFKVKDGVPVDDGLMKFGKNLFHKLGLPPGKAEMAFNEWQEFATTANASQVEQARVQNETEMRTLTEKWGPSLEENRAAGNRAVQALGLSPALIERVEANIGSAAIVELLATIGRKSDEGAFKGGGVNADPNDPNTMTKEQAASRIRELQNDAGFWKKYTDKNDPGNRDAISTMEKLFAKAG